MITTHRYEMLMDLAKIARDLEDEVLLAAVRRLIVADRRGFMTHSTRADRNLAMEAAEAFL